MIRVEGLSVRLSGRIIVSDLNLDISKGEFFVLIGPNGSGKSTVVKALSRIVEPTGGLITVCGRSQSSFEGREYARRVATMPQHHSRIEGLSVYDRVIYGRIPHSGLFGSLGVRDHALIEEVMRETDVWDLRKRRLTTLSGGELQRVHLAGCFAQQPEVLILDEPTNHLDIKHQYGVLTMVKRRTRTEGLTALCVLHDINQTFRYADRVAMMKDGRIKVTGKPEDVIREDHIKDLYEMESRVHVSGDRRWVEFMEPSSPQTTVQQSNPL
jgi:iron complex transport system ATP-binding protein